MLRFLFNSYHGKVKKNLLLVPGFCPFGSLPCSKLSCCLGLTISNINSCLNILHYKKYMFVLISISCRSTNRPQYFEYFCGAPPEVGKRSVVPSQPLIITASGVAIQQSQVLFPASSQFSTGYQERPSEAPR